MQRSDETVLEGVPAGNKFRSHSLGFEMEKPANWAFLPTIWADKIKKRVDFTKAQSRMIAQAGTPFVYIHYQHESLDYAYPTVQVNARLIEGYMPTMAEFLQKQVEVIERTFPDFV